MSEGKEEPEVEGHDVQPGSQPGRIDVGPGDAGLVRAVFTDDLGDAYAQVRVASPAPHLELRPVASGSMRQILEEAWYTANGEQLPPRQWALDQVRRLEFLAARAGTRKLWERFAWHDAGVWIDLADDLGRAVRIGPDGWEVVSDPPPLFRRHRHQRALPEPQPGRDATELLRFLPAMEPGDGLLCLTWAALAPVTTISRPILVPWGDYGAGKSTLCRRLRDGLDPSQVPLLGEDERRDLVVTLSRHAVFVLDNSGGLRPQEADVFCRAVTGGANVRRKLFTDSEEVIFKFRRPVMINGIDLPSLRPDFLDRCLLLRLRRLDGYRPEEELDAEFAAALPGLLGGMYDLLARAMRLLPGLEPGPGFRMADFARWGRAVAAALDKEPGEFDAAFKAAVERQAREVVEADPVGRAMIQYMADKDGPITIEGAKLFAALKEIADTLHFGGEWPNQKSGAFSKRLLALEPTLKKLGIEVKKLQETTAVRSRWRLLRLPPA